MKVLITGASRGIGRAIAEKFLSEGWEVIGTYEKSDYEADELRKKGIQMFKSDVSDKSAVKELEKQVGDIDALINNAGVNLFGVFQSITEEQEKRLYGVNLFGVLNMTRAFLPYMINNKSGSIVNISSIFGETGGSCEVDYSAAKAALIGLTKALAKEVGPSCVRVNCVTPGVIDTDMNANLTVEDVHDLEDRIPLETLGKPYEIAEAVYFLASEKASYITGTVLAVNGGFSE